MQSIPVAETTHYTSGSFWSDKLLLFRSLKNPLNLSGFFCAFRKILEDMVCFSSTICKMDWGAIPLSGNTP